MTLLHFWTLAFIEKRSLLRRLVVIIFFFEFYAYLLFRTVCLSLSINIWSDDDKNGKHTCVLILPPYRQPIEKGEEKATMKEERPILCKA